MSSVRILCFHRVIRDADRERFWPWVLRGSAITASAFKERISEVGASHDWVSETEIRAIIDGADRRSRPSCWVTFDDGYYDNLEVAAPILSDLGVRPTLFLTTNVLQEGFLLPVDRWYLTLLGTRRHCGRIEEEGGTWNADVSTEHGRLHLVCGPQKQRYVQATAAVQADMTRALGAAFEARITDGLCRSRARYLSQADLQTLSAMGWRIGHHGASHRLWLGLNDEELCQEIVKPAIQLSELSVDRSSYVAWPDGAWSAATQECIAGLLEPRGYLGGLTIEPRMATPKDHLWILPRFIES